MKRLPPFFPLEFTNLVRRCVLALLFIVFCEASGADWPQVHGPSGGFRVKDRAPIDWSVAKDENVKWKARLPETGQSTPIVVDAKVFVTTVKPLGEDAEVAKDIIAWCFDANTGKELWSREIEGRFNLRLSGAFGDSSGPAAVSDGERVAFINASGMIACFDFEGRELWTRDILSVSRSRAFLNQGNLVFTRQAYEPDAEGKFPHTHKDAPVEEWTQLQAVDMETGEISWTSRCGVNMGCALLPQKLENGKDVVVVGRGGGHSPPEKPEGISLVSLDDGSTLWTLPLGGYMATQSIRVRKNEIHLFHGDAHLTVDAMTGERLRTLSISENIKTRRRFGNAWEWRKDTIPLTKKRMVTQGSNLLVGAFHFFRSYTHPYLGRVNVDTGEVSYLELPLQLKREKGEADAYAWYEAPATKKDSQMKDQFFAPNDMKNSAGYVVMGDKRSQGNGWGHIAAATPSVAGPHLYIPTMSGTVYVMKWKAENFDESAIVGINDLGPVGQAWNRASLSFAEGNLFAHTIDSLICVSEDL